MRASLGWSLGGALVVAWLSCASPPEPDEGSQEADAGSEVVDGSVDASLSPPSSLRMCVDMDAGVCLNVCDPGEICFTQLSCSLAEDGGSPCAWSGNAGGDNRCHVSCESSSCPSGESCNAVAFFACYDYNGSPNGGRNVCCPTSGCP